MLGRLQLGALEPVANGTWRGGHRRAYLSVLSKQSISTGERAADPLRLTPSAPSGAPGCDAMLLLFIRIESHSVSFIIRAALTLKACCGDTDRACTRMGRDRIRCSGNRRAGAQPRRCDGRVESVGREPLGRPAFTTYWGRAADPSEILRIALFRSQCHAPNGSAIAGLSLGRTVA